MSYTVAQNTSFLTFASILQKVVSFGYFTIIARLIGVENTGSYFFAITFTTIFTVVADFGMGPILTRESAKYPDKQENYFKSAIFSKIIFGIGTYLLVIFFANLLNYSVFLRQLIYLSAVTMFFDNIQGAFFSVFRAQKNLIYESVGIVMAQVLTLIIGTTALLLKAPLIWLIAAYTIPSAIVVCFAAYNVKKLYGLKFTFGYDKEIFSQMFRMAVPFAVAGIIGRLYSYSDSLIMSKMLTAEDMGWWSVPYKITFAFQFIPVALSASVYPAMSTLTISQPEKVGELFVKAWKYLFIIVFPLSFGLMAVAKPVITYLYGNNYSPSIPVLQILLVSLIFSYLSIISGALLNATGKQKTQTIILGVALVCNLLMNLYLIPSHGIMGAAYSALASNILLWTLGFYFVRKNTMLYSGMLLKNGLHVLVLAMIMASVVSLLTKKIGFIFSIPIGAAIYLILIFATGIITKESLKVVYEKIRIRKTV